MGHVVRWSWRSRDQTFSRASRRETRRRDIKYIETGARGCFVIVISDRIKSRDLPQCWNHSNLGWIGARFLRGVSLSCEYGEQNVTITIVARSSLRSQDRCNWLPSSRGHARFSARTHACFEEFLISRGLWRNLFSRWIYLFNRVGIQ